MNKKLPVWAAFYMYISNLAGYLLVKLSDLFETSSLFSVVNKGGEISPASYQNRSYHNHRDLCCLSY